MNVRQLIGAHGGLLTKSELAAYWGVSQARASVITRRADFPEPIETMGGRKLYLADEADAWRVAERPAGRPTNRS